MQRSSFVTGRLPETRGPDIAEVLRPFQEFPALYAHIPFCSSKCSYCDFHSVPLKDAEVAERVLKSELAELDFLLRRIQTSSFSTLYVGGGTPSILSGNILRPFLEGLSARSLRDVREFTVEANPESLDRDFLFLAEACGVSRISLGLQTFDDDGLALLGRRASARKNRSALELVGAHWKGKASLDLIYGYPGQTYAAAEKDLREVLAFRPGHLSLYALTLEEETPLAAAIGKGLVLPLEEDGQEDIREGLHLLLEAAGYSNYEISNYALPGEECEHNRYYWDLKPYLGLGPGGVSTLPADPPYAALRLTGKPSFEDYLEADFSGEDLKETGGFEIETVGAAEMLRDFVLMGLRTSRGIDEKRFERIFSRPLSGMSRETRKRQADAFFRNDGYLGLSEKGRRFLNTILADLFLEFDGNETVTDCRWP